MGEWTFEQYYCKDQIRDVHRMIEWTLRRAQEKHAYLKIDPYFTSKNEPILNVSTILSVVDEWMELRETKTSITSTADF